MDDPIERARQARRFYRLAADGSSPDSVRVPFEATLELAQHLISDGHGTVEQIVPLGPGAPRGEAATGLWWRRLAQHAAVRRYYLVPAGEATIADAIRRAGQDAKHGMTSLTVPVTGGGPISPPRWWRRPRWCGSPRS